MLRDLLSNFPKLSPTPTRLNQSVGSPRSNVENDDTVLNEAGITRLVMHARLA